jgi:hypothetical protein
MARDSNYVRLAAAVEFFDLSAIKVAMELTVTVAYCVSTIAAFLESCVIAMPNASIAA